MFALAGATRDPASSRRPPAFRLPLSAIIRLHPPRASVVEFWYRVREISRAAIAAL